MLIGFCCLLRKVQTGSGPNPGFFSFGQGGPGRTADHSPPRADVKNEWSFTSPPSIRLSDADGHNFASVLSHWLVSLKESIDVCLQTIQLMNIATKLSCVCCVTIERYHEATCFHPLWPSSVYFYKGTLKRRIKIKYRCLIICFRGFGGLELACCPLVPKFAGSNPNIAVGFFQGEKILSTPFFGGEVKPSVPCRRFTACKRSLNVTWKSGIFQAKFIGPFLAHVVPPLPDRISWSGESWNVRKIRRFINISTSGR